MAENELSGILDRIMAVGGHAASAGANLIIGNTYDAARDGVLAAVALAGEETRQRQELTTLRRNLANEKWQLQSASTELSRIEQDIYLATNILRANDC